MFEKLSDSDFTRFRDLIYNSSNIHFTEFNRPILESRLKERLKKSGLAEIGDYFKLVSTNESELKILLDSVTTNLTRFFRNQLQFDTLAGPVLSEIKKRKTNKEIKVWSAGCSTGEEPYTLAMVLKEGLDPSWKIEIIASDISFNVLMKAKEGFYQKSRVEGLTDYYIKKYMKESEDGFTFNDDIKKLIRFDYHNLKNDSGIRNIDIVFCRNVIIYFDAKGQEQVVNKIYETMGSYSYFFIGHSESLFGMNTKFVFTKIDDACLYLKKEGV